jgi:RNA polymerase sigma-70 factor (ECF subfamily)
MFDRGNWKREKTFGAHFNQEHMMPVNLTSREAVHRPAQSRPLVPQKVVGSSQMIAGCQERVFRLALRITRNLEDAEDSRQEALLKAHRKMGQFEGRSQFTTWISRIAINEALMNLRKRRRAIHEPFEDAMSNIEIRQESWANSPVESPDRAYARRELRDTLRMAIDRLRPNYRSVFLMRAVEDLSTSETAQSLGISVSAVKTRMRRARRELQGILQSQSPDTARRTVSTRLFPPKLEAPALGHSWVA